MPNAPINDNTSDIIARLSDARTKIIAVSRALKQGSRNAEALLEAAHTVLCCIGDIGDIMDHIDDEEHLWPLLKRCLGEFSEKTRMGCKQEWASLKSDIKRRLFTNGS